MPPRANPSTTTVISSEVRTSRIDRPVRRARPVISPSRGPGPSWLPMYIAPATPLPAMASSMTAIRQPRPSMAGTTASVASMATPMTTALSTVPRPGHWRSGIQSSSTTNDTTMLIAP